MYTFLLIELIIVFWGGLETGFTIVFKPQAHATEDEV